MHYFQHAIVLLLSGLAIGCTHEQRNNSSAGPETYSHMSVTRSIDVLPDDMTGNITLLEWQERLLQKIEAGTLSAYEDPAMEVPLDPGHLDQAMVVEETKQVTPEGTTYQGHRDTTIRHSLEPVHIRSIRLADSLTFNDSFDAYQAQNFAFALVLHYERPPQDPITDVIAWIRFDDLYEVFDAHEVNAFETYLFEWYNPNP